ncbi:PGF-pre-PGF domain-containing protein [Methanofollis aquaemaris]|nr:PGF-pre-PGF domain-containing protein [Methanofollis aquaemaris]
MGRSLLALVILLLAACAVPVAADDVGGITMPGTSNFDLQLSDGLTKFFKFEGGGLNALHISTDPESEPYGQVTTTEEQSGIFYLTNTGGRGFTDDMILMIAINGTIPDDFALHIRASGYQWTPTPVVNAPPAADEVEYVDGTYEGTITKDNFVYSPQTWKPAGNNQPGAYPIYYGQDVSDGSNPFHTVYIDLHAGTLGENSLIENLRDNGAVKIEYEFENLPTYASFNSYGWCNQSNQGLGISWTNRVSGVGSSGYSVVGTAPPGAGDVSPDGGSDGTSDASGLSGNEMEAPTGKCLHGSVSLLPVAGTGGNLAAGERATLTFNAGNGTGTLKTAVFYLFVSDSKKGEDGTGTEPQLTVRIDGKTVEPDETYTDRAGKKDAPVAATYVFKLEGIRSGDSAVTVENAGTGDEVCTIDGGALLLVREDPALPEIIWQVVAGCDAVAIDEEGGVFEDDAVSRAIFDDSLNLDQTAAARLLVTGTGSAGILGFNDREWTDALRAEGSVLTADLDVLPVLFPRENIAMLRATKDAASGGVLESRVAVLVTISGTPPSSGDGDSGSSVAPMTRAFIADNPIVKKVSVTLPEQRTPFHVEVRDLETAGTMQAPDAPVYRYLDIGLSGARADPTSLVVTFRVPPSWMEEQGLEPRDVTLMRYTGSTWTPLATDAGSVRDGYQEFSASSDGLSIFAIAGVPGRDAQVAQERAASGSTGNEVPATTPQQSSPLWVVSLFAAGVVLLIRQKI